MQRNQGSLPKTGLPWVMILFACAFLFSYFMAFMTTKELRLPNGLPDPRQATPLGWVMTFVVSIQSAIVLGITWRIKETKSFTLFGRAVIGFLTFLGLVVLAGLSLFLITWVWLKLTYFAEFSPPMKGCFLSAGVHIVGFLTWLPVHILLWCIPWKVPPRQPNPPLNSDPACIV